MGVGGSIPFIAEFLEAFPQASVLVTGVEDPDTRAHGANEGLHLAEFEKVVLAEALLLRNLGVKPGGLTSPLESDSGAVIVGGGPGRDLRLGRLPGLRRIG